MADGQLVNFYAELGLSEPAKRVDLAERLDEADAKAVEAMGAYTNALQAQLDARSKEISGDPDLKALADRASTALQELNHVQGEVRQFVGGEG